MAPMGWLERVAQADLEAFIEDTAREYSEGTLGVRTALDPGWREALDQTELELGVLYEELRAADATWVRWRETLAELRRLWARTREASDAATGTTSRELEDVA